MPDNTMPPRDTPEYKELVSGETILTPAGTPLQTASDYTPPPGNSRFELGPLIGEGGMAAVYEARDLAFQRTVALKILKPKLAEDEEQRARFRQEAMVVAQMDHPHALPVYDIGETEDLGLFIAMKKVEGETFRTMIRRGRPHGKTSRYQLAKQMEVYEQICQVVSYAHARRVVHRDLKPDNVMVDDYGEAIVLDWGMAKMLPNSDFDIETPVTEEGIIKGTPVYMSPEQASGKEIDMRTDVFSLGIILYELLTGRLPFAGESVSEVLDKVVTREPLPPLKQNKKADKVLCAICMKALAKEPDQRYASAVELCDDIRLWRSRLPTSAYCPCPRERATSWIKRNPIASTSLFTAIITLLAIGLFHFHRRELRQAQEAETLNLIAKNSRKAIAGLEEAMVRSEDYRTQIEDLTLSIKHLSADTPAEYRQRLARKRNELQTARNALHSFARVQFGLIFGAIREYKQLNTLNDQTLAFAKELVLSEIEASITSKECYRASFLLWRHLENTTILTWTPAERKRLQQMKETVLDEMKRRYGPQSKPPNWREYALPKIR